MNGRRKPKDESGFALLFVFLLAAGIALMLYTQLPRTAFESVRGKEELLVDHAAQYQRAIQLYVAKYQKYPAAMDDLEKTNNIRFLRRRYKDPFTGKDDWRLIHVDNQGKLTDSLVEKKEEKKANQNTFITEMSGIGQTNLGDDNPGVNVALRKRPSEGGTVDGGQAPLPLPSTAFSYPSTPVGPAIPNPVVDPNQVQPQPGQVQGQPQPGQVQGQPQPGQVQGQPQVQLQPGQIAAIQQQVPPLQLDPQNPNMQQVYPNGVPQYPGQVNPLINPATGQRYSPGQQPPYPTPGQPPLQTGSQQTQTQQNYGMMGPPPPSIGAQLQPAQPFPGQQQQTYPTQSATQPGRPGFAGITGFGPPGQGSPQSALDAIRSAITNPSPNMAMNLAPGLQIMGGLAGVASKHEGPSIRVVNEQTNYKKWEFVYDMKKDSRIKAALGQAQGALGQQNGQNGLNGNRTGVGGNGMMGSGQQNSFGSTGQGSGFGATGAFGGGTSSGTTGGSGMMGSPPQAQTPQIPQPGQGFPNQGSPQQPNPFGRR